MISILDFIIYSIVASFIRFNVDQLTFILSLVFTSIGLLVLFVIFKLCKMKEETYDLIPIDFKVLNYDSNFKENYCIEFELKRFISLKRNINLNNNVNSSINANASVNYNEDLENGNGLQMRNSYININVSNDNNNNVNNISNNNIPVDIELIRRVGVNNQEANLNLNINNHSRNIA
jgi:hypothetical protein